MKKLISLLLALTLVFGLAVSVAAVDGDPVTPTDGNYGDGSEHMTEFVIKVNYDLTNAGTTAPDETFKFTVTASDVSAIKTDGTAVTKTEMPAINNGSISVAFGANNSENGTADKDAATYGKLKITLPAASAFPALGVYKYLIHPVTPTNDSSTSANDTAGVAYHTGDIRLVITVQQDDSGRYTYAAVHTEAGENGPKNDSITETYSAGKLLVKKYVSGSLADTATPFTVKITLSSSETNKTYPTTFSVSSSGMNVSNNPNSITFGTETSFTILHGGTIEIDNIPYGVKVDVTEVKPTDYDEVKYDVADTDSYTAKSYKDTNFVGLLDTNNKISSNTKVVGIYNNKGVTPDTGVVLDNAPYLVLLAVAVIGLAVVIVKKRQARDY